MEPKWSLNGVKIEPKTNEKRVKNQVEIFAFFESSYQVSTRVFNDYTFFFYEISATCCRNSSGLSLNFMRNRTELVGKSCGNPQGIHWNYWGISADVAGNSY